MFGAVMMDEDNCKGLLERVLESKRLIVGTVIKSAVRLSGTV